MPWPPATGSARARAEAAASTDSGYRPWMTPGEPPLAAHGRPAKMPPQAASFHAASRFSRRAGLDAVDRADEVADHAGRVRDAHDRGERRAAIGGGRLGRALFYERPGVPVIGAAAAVQCQVRSGLVVGESVRILLAECRVGIELLDHGSVLLRDVNAAIGTGRSDGDGARLVLDDVAAVAVLDVDPAVVLVDVFGGAQGPFRLNGSAAARC